MTLVDKTARRVLVASLLYYRHDLSVMSDGEFDAACRFLSKRWVALDGFRQWQLGSAEEIATTGYHCRVTMACEGAARVWARTAGSRIKLIPMSEWRWDEIRSVSWTYAGG